jgi:hypothetical protein
MSAGNMLATAPSLEAVRVAICKFYGGESKTLVPVGDDSWKIIDTYSSKEAPGVRVVRQRGRFRFQTVTP